MRNTSPALAVSAGSSSSSSVISTSCSRLSIATSLRSVPPRPSRSNSGWSEPEDQGAQLLERLARQLLHPRHLLPRRLGIPIEQSRGGLGGQDQAEQLLADHVVELEGQTVALGED